VTGAGCFPAGYLFFVLEKSCFHNDNNPLAPALPLFGAGAHCDASELSVHEISPRLCTGTMALSQPGNAPAAVAESERFEDFVEIFFSSTF
jgi:hypothetical protein